MTLDRDRTFSFMRAGLLGCIAALPTSLQAQSARAVPSLDAQRFLGSWHVQAWIPTKPEKRCAMNATVLFAVGDGKNAFQMGTFCQRKDANTDQWDASGTLDKAGGGKLKLRHWVLFSRPYWVLAVDPGYEWALIGTPNHKVLRVLSKPVTISPELLTQIELTARAQGFDTAKLVRPAQNPEAMSAHPETTSAGQVAP